LLLRGERVQVLEGEGTVLGFPDLDDVHLSEETMRLLPGDRLVLYTDGLTDSMDPDGSVFGIDRLTSFLQSCRRLPASELCRATFAGLVAHQQTAEQFDDMTLLVMEVK
jgi:serine phosphatase RsbU (regulator of sigma subunit)